MLNEIKSLLNPKILNHHLLDSGKRVLRVKETGDDAKLKELQITNFPINAIHFTLDFPSNEKGKKQIYKQLSIYLNNQMKEINRSCDLVVIWLNNEQRLQVLVADLKSDTTKPLKLNHQLGNSKIFVEFLLHLAKLHCKKAKAFDLKNIDFWMTAISTRQRFTKPRIHKETGSTSRPEGIFKTVSVTAHHGKGIISFLDLL